jgi:hypothetical protein
MNVRMSEKERTIWEQAVRVLRQNSVTTIITVEPPRAQQVLAKARERAASQRRS